MFKVGDYVLWGTWIGKVAKIISNEGVCQIRWMRGSYSFLSPDRLKKYEVSDETKQDQKKIQETIVKLKKRLKKEESKVLNWL